MANRNLGNHLHQRSRTIQLPYFRKPPFPGSKFKSLQDVYNLLEKNRKYILPYIEPNDPHFEFMSKPLQLSLNFCNAGSSDGENVDNQLPKHESSIGTFQVPSENLLSEHFQSKEKQRDVLEENEIANVEQCTASNNMGLGLEKITKTYNNSVAESSVVPGILCKNENTVNYGDIGDVESIKLFSSGGVGEINESSLEITKYISAPIEVSASGEENSLIHSTVTQSDNSRYNETVSRPFDIQKQETDVVPIHVSDFPEVPVANRSIISPGKSKDEDRCADNATLDSFTYLQLEVDPTVINPEEKSKIDDLVVSSQLEKVDEVVKNSEMQIGAPGIAGNAITKSTSAVINKCFPISTTCQAVKNPEETLKLDDPVICPQLNTIDNSVINKVGIDCSLSDECFRDSEMSGNVSRFETVGTSIPIHKNIESSTNCQAVNELEESVKANSSVSSPELDLIKAVTHEREIDCASKDNDFGRPSNANEMNATSSVIPKDCQISLKFPALKNLETDSEVDPQLNIVDDVTNKMELSTACNSKNSLNPGVLEDMDRLNGAITKRTSAGVHKSVQMSTSCQAVKTSEAASEVDVVDEAIPNKMELSSASTSKHSQNLGVQETVDKVDENLTEIHVAIQKRLTNCQAVIPPEKTPKLDCHAKCPLIDTIDEAYPSSTDLIDDDSCESVDVASIDEKFNMSPTCLNTFPDTINVSRPEPPICNIVSVVGGYKEPNVDTAFSCPDLDEFLEDLNEFPKERMDSNKLLCDNRPYEIKEVGIKQPKKETFKRSLLKSEVSYLEPVQKKFKNIPQHLNKTLKVTEKCKQTSRDETKTIIKHPPKLKSRKTIIQMKHGSAFARSGGSSIILSGSLAFSTYFRNKVASQSNCLVKNIALVVYPGLNRLQPLIEMHLLKLRGEKTVVDSSWAKFATTAVLDRNNKVRKLPRKIVLSTCPIKLTSDEIIIDRFVKSPYYKELKVGDLKASDPHVEELVGHLIDEVSRKQTPSFSVPKCAVVLNRLDLRNVIPFCLNHQIYCCKQCGLDPELFVEEQKCALVDLKPSTSQVKNISVLKTYTAKKRGRPPTAKHKKIYAEHINILNSVMPPPSPSLINQSHNITYNIKSGNGFKIDSEARPLGEIVHISLTRLREYFVSERINVYLKDGRLFIASSLNPILTFAENLKSTTTFSSAVRKIFFHKRSVFGILYSWGHYYEFCGMYENPRTEARTVNKWSLTRKFYGTPDFAKNHLGYKWLLLSLDHFFDSIRINSHEYEWYINASQITSETRYIPHPSFPFFGIHKLKGNGTFIAIGPYKHAADHNVLVILDGKVRPLYPMNVAVNPTRQKKEVSLVNFVQQSINHVLAGGYVVRALWLHATTTTSMALNLLYGPNTGKKLRTSTVEYLVSDIPRLGYFTAYVEEDSRWIKHPFKPDRKIVLKSVKTLNKFLQRHIPALTEAKDLNWRAFPHGVHLPQLKSFNATNPIQRQTTKQDKDFEFELACRNLLQAIGFEGFSASLDVIVKNAHKLINELQLKNEQQVKEISELKRLGELKAIKRNSILKRSLPSKTKLPSNTTVVVTPIESSTPNKFRVVAAKIKPPLTSPKTPIKAAENCHYSIIPNSVIKATLTPQMRKGISLLSPTGSSSQAIVLTQAQARPSRSPESLYQIKVEHTYSSPEKAEDKRKQNSEILLPLPTKSPRSVLKVGRDIAIPSSSQKPECATVDGSVRSTISNFHDSSVPSSSDTPTAVILPSEKIIHSSVNESRDQSQNSNALELQPKTTQSSVGESRDPSQNANALELQPKITQPSVDASRDPPQNTNALALQPIITQSSVGESLDQSQNSSALALQPKIKRRIKYTPRRQDLSSSNTTV